MIFHFILNNTLNILIFISQSIRRLSFFRKKSYLRYQKIKPLETPAYYPNRPKPEWVKEKIIHIKAIMGEKVGCRKIADYFNRGNHKGETVGKTYVANLIAKHQYEIQVERRKIKNTLPRWVAVSCTWAMDLSFYTTADKITQPFLGLIDHGSRKALTLQTLVNKNSWTLLGHLCLAIGKYGKPKKLRTDNEIIFTSFVFRTFLKLINIQQQKIPTASPWCNGRIERLFGTLKPMIEPFEIENKNELQRWLNHFTTWYNQKRPHQNLNGKTPEDVWRRRG